MTVGTLRSVMGKTEYYDWLRYFKYKTPDSLEIQMAVLTAMVAQGLGSKKVTAEDFIIHKEYGAAVGEASTPHEMSSDEVQSFFGMIATPME